MARTKREISSTGIYHVLLRGEGNLFFAQRDYTQFISLLEHYFTGTSQRLFAYSLNEEKIHLILFEGEMGLAKVMKPICTSYARYINREHGRDGKLFYDRYKSEVIETGEYLLDCVVYVHKTEGITSAPEYIADSSLCDTKLFFEKAGGKALYLQRMEQPVQVMCLDDYEHMTDKKAAFYIQQLCGCAAEKLKTLSKEEQLKAINAVKAQKWISARRIAELTGIGKGTVNRAGTHVPRAPRPKQEQPKPTQKQADRELSVWLL